MSTPFLAELRIFSFNFPPKGWALANGQLLAINQNQALFSLLGTTYGGDGIRTFGLPNFQGLVPIGFTNPNYPLGQTGGEQTHTLIAAEMPLHTHSVTGSSATGTTNSPTNNVLATSAGLPYTPMSPDVLMSTSELATTGGGQAHENRQPYLVLSICIALQGIFPSRN